MDFITFYNNHVKEYLELEDDIFNIQKSIYFNLGSNLKHSFKKKTRILAPKDYLRIYGNSLVYSKDLGDFLCRICRKFEALCKLILRNTELGQQILISVNRRNLNIGDYKKFILRLWPDITNQEVMFKDYILIPFSSLNQKKNDQLEWWTEHNRIKHDEIEDLKRGNLKNVLNALAALYIMVCRFLKDLASEYKRNNDIPDNSLSFTPMTSNHFKIKDFDLNTPVVEDIPYYLTQKDINTLNRLIFLI